jgi:hypothetical protein
LDHNLTEAEFQTLAYRISCQKNCKKIYSSFKANIKTKFRSKIVDVTSGSKHKMKV